jgi:hypothetical protein
MSTISPPVPAVPLSATPADDAGAAKMSDRVKGALIALGSVSVAVITLLVTFGAVNWSSTQTGLVTAEAAAAVGFLTACVAHFLPGTKKEPVAIGGTFTALVAATLALMSGFDVWKLTQDEISALVGLVIALIAVGTALFARSQVRAEPQKARS